MAFKLRLPDIKRIQICNISDSDSDLVNSFLNWTPSHLKILYIYHYAPSGTPIKYKLDINSLSKAVAAVTKEVYISCFEFSAADLQQLIRAACNAERIVFYLCSVHCSSALDFGATIEYNTNFLGFDRWGDTSCRELETDWKTAPSCFSHIVDAIDNSELRHSLTKLNIYQIQTLKKTRNEGADDCKENDTHWCGWRIFKSKYLLKLCLFTKQIFLSLFFFLNFRLKFSKNYYKI